MKFDNSKLLWTIVLGYIAFIYLSIPFGRNIARDIYSILGWKYYNLLIIIIFVIVFYILFSKIYITFKRFIVIVFVVVSLALAYFFTKFPTDKLHLVVYTLLGFFIFKATDKIENLKLRIFFSLTFITAIAIEDEILQSMFPDRSVELTDIIRDFIGGLAGILIAKIRV